MSFVQLTYELKREEDGDRKNTSVFLANCTGKRKIDKVGEKEMRKARRPR